MFFNLPDNISRKIFNFFTPKDLGRTTRVCRAWHTFFDDDRLWLNLLIKTFHFATQTAEIFKNKKNKTYKDLYQYCQTYQLNQHHRDALAKFRKFGLTENHLKGRDWNSSIYVELLEKFVYFCSYTIEEAMQTLDSLDDDITTNQIEEFIKLLSSGFNKLVSSPHFSCLSTEFFHDTHIHDAYIRGIKAGLTFDAMHNLKYAQIEALIEFGSSGLEHTDFINHGYNDAWDGLKANHLGALRVLVNVKKYSVKDAMEKLKELDDDQAKFIKNGGDENAVPARYYSVPSSGCSL